MCSDKRAPLKWEGKDDTFHMKTAPSSMQVLQTENFNLSFSLRFLPSEMMLIWPRRALLLPPPHARPPQPWRHPFQAPSLLSRRRSCERRRVLVPVVSVAPQLLLIRHGLDLKHQPCKFESAGVERRTWTFKETLPVRSHRAGPGNRRCISAVPTPPAPPQPGPVLEPG